MLVFKRQMLYSWRNPRSVMGYLLIGLLNGLLYGAIFWHLGAKRLEDIDPRNPEASVKHNA